MGSSEYTALMVLQGHSCLLSNREALFVSVLLYRELLREEGLLAPGETWAVGCHPGHSTSLFEMSHKVWEEQRSWEYVGGKGTLKCIIKNWHAQLNSFNKSLGVGLDAAERSAYEEVGLFYNEGSQWRKNKGGTRANLR